MKHIAQFFRRLLCQHRDWAFVRNIYGDEIVHSGRFKRSWWECRRCGARKSSPELHAAHTPRCSQDCNQGRDCACGAATGEIQP